MTRSMPERVAVAFDGFPPAARPVLEEVRRALFLLADDLGVGPLSETLKWGQPAYLTEATGAGTTVRLGVDAGDPAVFVHCRTTLVESFRAEHPEAFGYGGTRALRLRDGFDGDVLAIFLGRALTYRRAKCEVAA